jgi:hypothetical protein
MRPSALWQTRSAQSPMTRHLCSRDRNDQQYGIAAVLDRFVLAQLPGGRKVWGSGQAINPQVASLAGKIAPTSGLCLLLSRTGKSEGAAGDRWLPAQRAFGCHVSCPGSRRFLETAERNGMKHVPMTINGHQMVFACSTSSRHRTVRAAKKALANIPAAKGRGTEGAPGHRMPDSDSIDGPNGKVSNKRVVNIGNRYRWRDRVCVGWHALPPSTKM